MALYALYAGQPWGSQLCEKVTSLNSSSLRVFNYFPPFPVVHGIVFGFLRLFLLSPTASHSACARSLVDSPTHDIFSPQLLCLGLLVSGFISDVCSSIPVVSECSALAVLSFFDCRYTSQARWEITPSAAYFLRNIPAKNIKI